MELQNHHAHRIHRALGLQRGAPGAMLLGVWRASQGVGEDSSYVYHRTGVSSRLEASEWRSILSVDFNELSRLLA
jgi:hypothetical protein